MALVAFILSVLALMMQAFTVENIYNWYLATPLGTQTLAFSTVLIGIMTVKLAMANIHKAPNKDEVKSPEDRASLAAAFIFMSTIVLLIFWLLK